MVEATPATTETVATDLVQVWKSGARRGELLLTVKERELLASAGFTPYGDEDVVTCEVLSMSGTSQCSVRVARGATLEEIKRAVAQAGRFEVPMFKLLLGATVLVHEAASPLRSVEGGTAVLSIVHLKNLISNGDFDSGSEGEIPLEWRRYGSYGNTGLVSTEQHYVGSQSIKYWGPGWQLIETPCLELRATEEYELRFWAKSQSASQTIRTEFLAYIGSDSTTQFERLPTASGEYVHEHTVSMPDTWECFTHPALRPSRSETYVRINIGTHNLQGVLFIDDVQLLGASA